MNGNMISLYITVAGFAAWALVERFFHLRGFSQRWTSSKENISFVLINAFWYVAILLSFTDAFYTSWTVRWIGLHWARWLGVALIVTGIGIRYLARRELGRQYSVHVQTSDAHVLVSSGIYQLIRHPAYLGLLCLLIGIPTAAWSLPGIFVALAGGIPSVVYRIRQEESALEEWFGEAYRQYCQNTWRLMTGIW
jgi:protein-S-isoprenylcysteine O-methyltransferase Ste14